MLRRNQSWLVWIPRIFKFSIFVPKLSFLRKNTRKCCELILVFWISQKAYAIFIICYFQIDNGSVWQSYIGWITKYTLTIHTQGVFHTHRKIQRIQPKWYFGIFENEDFSESIRWPMNFENSWLRIWPGQFTLSLRKIITRKSYQPGQKHEGLKSIGIVKWRSMTVFLWNE